ncbi:MAG: hypothetical protein II574_00875 [Ruminococcus sp.]|nr:hypothetical protein [Ruminococcus sp.]
MKKTFLRIILILIAIFVSVCLLAPFSASDYDDGQVSVRVSDVPEGTAYVELLVPVFDIPEEHLNTHEHKVKLCKTSYNDGDESAERADAQLLLDTDSEIAKYADEDGYVSLMAHTDMVHSYTAFIMHRNNETAKYSSNMVLSGSIDVHKNDGYCRGIDFSYLQRTFRKIKAAYVDENGHILSVTSSFSSGYDSPRGINVSGDSVRLARGENLGGYLWEALTPEGKFIVIAVFCIYILIVIAAFKPQKRSK